MGDIEKRTKVKVHKERLQRAVLSTLATVGVMSIALVAPNALMSLKKSGLDRKLKGWEKQGIDRSIQKLIERDLIEFKQRGNNKFLSITAKGEKRLRLWEMHDFIVNKPRKWDRKWRIIIFDIQEKRRSVRDQLRLTLEGIGFVKLQQSVWVYPYPCEDFITLIKADFELGRRLLYIVADEIENDIYLRRHFQLK